MALSYHIKLFGNYCYKGTSGSYYTRRGGRSSLGSYCGAFSVNLAITASAATWYSGAALSYKSTIVVKLIVIDIVCMVVILVIIFIVDLFMLIYIMLILVHIGVMAQHYHIN